MSEPFVPEGGSIAYYNEYLGLRIGDIVQLKSGGPEMTVTQISKWANEPDFKITVQCEWFSGNPNKGKVAKEFELLPPTSLKKKVNAL